MGEPPRLRGCLEGYAVIALSDVSDKLLSLDEAKNILAPLEAMGESEFAMGEGSVEFTFPDKWNADLATLDGTDTTEATIAIGGSKFQLTKDAALAASSLVGLSRRYVSVTPGHLIEPHLNYWYGQQGGYQNWSKNLKLIHRDESVGVAFCRSAMNTYSMQRVLAEAMDSIYDRYGKGTTVYVDRKMEAGIRSTAIRLIVPESERSVPSRFAEEEGNDPWSVGLALQTSLTGEVPLGVSGYLFRYVCVNGATTQHSHGVKHRRSRGEQAENVYDWLGNEIDAILASMEDEMAHVEALTTMKLAGEVSQILANLFEQFNVPIPSREKITNELVESDDLSAYGVMQAVTEAANDVELSPTEVARLMGIGGALPHVLSARCPSCKRFSL